MAKAVNKVGTVADQVGKLASALLGGGIKKETEENEDLNTNMMQDRISGVEERLEEMDKKASAANERLYKLLESVLNQKV